jgi:hypothetical protein
MKNLYKKIKQASLAALMVLTVLAAGNAQIINPATEGGFENGTTFAANGWSIDNGTVGNQWFLGNVASIPAGVVSGSRAAYISPDAGVTNGYNNGSVSIVHFWRDVTIPAGQTDITLAFTWASLGETSSFDALMVSVAPTTYTPVASNVSLGTSALAAPATTVAQLWNQAAVQNASIKIPANLVNNCVAAATIRLIFTWKNDGSLGTNPAASIDNISLTAAAVTPVAAGTYTVGPTGTYTSLTAAANAINAAGVSGPVILELQSTYVSTVETFPITLAGQTNCSPLTATNNVTIRPAAGAPVLTISGSNATSIFDINNGQWWRIDGRAGGTGTTQGLVLANTNTSGSVVRLINEGSNNIVRYCNVQGVNTSTVNGLFFFSTTTGANGNDNNLIEFCDIRDGATTPLNGVYSSGTTTTIATHNSGNTISNNNVYNTFGASSTSYGINVVGGSTDWTITGNSIYQTASRSTSTIWGGDSGIQCDLWK